MSKVDVLLGLQWGDEGKGKIVDVITPEYDLICRFQGGPNAGHTIEFGGKKHVLHTVPSGIFREQCINIIGNGVVIDPVTFENEIEELKSSGLDAKKRILISRRAHLILPTHRMLDEASEAAKGKGKIGSTLKGIGPAYMDKTGRNGLRVGDIELPDFKERYDALVEKHKQILSHYAFSVELDEKQKIWFEAIRKLSAFKFIDSEHYINEALLAGKKVLAEGAQGSLLDIDFGTYPYVTSSTTMAAGACTGLGIAPNKIGRVIGIFKAYCTRVGGGPFPSELTDDVGEKIRKIGNEFGSTTGRARRCGWLDLPALKYAILLNGVTELCMMKADVLEAFENVKVCTRYKCKSGTTEALPYLFSPGSHEPDYLTFPAWKKGGSNPSVLDPALLSYIRFVEQQTGVPIRIVSLGPGRDETMVR